MTQIKTLILEPFQREDIALLRQLNCYINNISLKSPGIVERIGTEIEIIRNILI